MQYLVIITLGNTRFCSLSLLWRTRRWTYWLCGEKFMMWLSNVWQDINQAGKKKCLVLLLYKSVITGGFVKFFNFSIWWWWDWWIVFPEWLTYKRHLRFISSWNHCQKFSTWQIAHTLQVGFEHAQNLSSNFVEWSCTVVITITPRRQFWVNLDIKAAVCSCSTEKPFKKISRHLQENNPLAELSFSKVAGKRSLTFIKTNSATSVF